MSMYMHGIIVLGQDARTFPSADGTKTYASVAGWWKHGRGDDRRFQWCDLKLLTNGAATAAPMLTKGKSIQVIVSNPHVEVFEPKDKSKPVGAKIVGIIDRFDFVGPKDAATPPPPPARRDFTEPAPAPAYDDDIPY